jgi:hypothetical protein
MPEPCLGASIYLSPREAAHDALGAAWAQELKDGCLADITVRIAAEERDFRVSRFPLALASPVFKAMLFPGEGGEWMEHRANAVVRLEDITADAFEEVLRHAYRVGEKLTAQNVIYVLQAADKYQMTQLKDACKAKAEELLSGTVEDALALFDAAVKVNLWDMLPSILDAYDGLFLLQSRALPSICLQSLQKLLASSFDGREDDVWTACRAWAEHAAVACGGPWQVAMQPLRPLIRFPHISQHLFDTQIAKSGVLSTVEDWRLSKRRSTFSYISVDPSF